MGRTLQLAGMPAAAVWTMNEPGGCGSKAGWGISPPRTRVPSLTRARTDSNQFQTMDITCFYFDPALDSVQPGQSPGCPPPRRRRARRSARRNRAAATRATRAKAGLDFTLCDADGNPKGRNRAHQAADCPSAQAFGHCDGGGDDVDGVMPAGSRGHPLSGCST